MRTMNEVVVDLIDELYSIRAQFDDEPIWHKYYERSVLRLVEEIYELWDS